MSRPGPALAGVCPRCARRSWLLSCLSAPLDALADDPARLWAALSLKDAELIGALAGASLGDLSGRWERWSLDLLGAQGESFGHGRPACRHHCRYPERLRDDPLAPHSLVVFDHSAAGCWNGLDERRVVAIAGASSPSGYGLGAACALARDLAAAGVIVAGSESGVGAAARSAALAAGGSALCVAPASLSADGDDSRRTTEQASECRVVEPVGVAAASRWPALAAERTLALIADLVLVVQAHEGAGLDLACAEVACSRRIEVAVVPGPIDAPASRASNRLLAGGARVVCDSREALDALFGVGATTAGRDGFGSCSGRKARPRAAEGRPRRPAASRIHERPLVALDPGQQAVLDLLVAGERTLAQLGDELADADGAAIAVAGLELSGLAVRGDDGRYRSRSAGHLR